MKYKHIALLLALVAVACHKMPADVPQEKDEPSEPVAEVTFTATFADMVTSKVSIESGKTTMIWTPGDEIAVFGGNEAERFHLEGNEPARPGKFVSETDSKTPTFSKYYAIYPFTAAFGCSSEGVFSVNMSAAQKYSSDSFDSSAALMGAVTKDTESRELVFRNACGFIGVRLCSRSEANVKKIELSGNCGENIAGPATLTLTTSGNPMLEISAPTEDRNGGFGEDFSNNSGTWTTKSGAAQTPSRKITLDCGSGTDLGEDPTTFIFCVPAVNFTKGVTIAVTDAEGTVSKTSFDEAVNVSRSDIILLDPMQIEQAGGGTELCSFSLKDSSGNLYEAKLNGGTNIDILVPASAGRSQLIPCFEITGSELQIGGVNQISGVTVNDFSSGNFTVKVISNKGKVREYMVRLLDKPFKISCWGDSLTHTSYNETAPLPIAYTVILQEMLGNSWEVFDGGVSGDNTAEIAARQGGIRSFFKCSGSSPTSIYLDPALDQKGSFRCNRWSVSAAQPARGVNPAMINGVECNIQYNSVQPVIPGAPVTVTDGTEIITYASRYCKDNDVLVVYMGAGGGFKNYDNLIEQYKAMIDHCDKKQYIILTMHNSINFQIQATDTEYLKKINDTFGEHVINLRSEVNARAEEFLIKTGVVSKASEISEKDREYINNGDWPLSFLRSESDMHFTREGSIVVCNLIIEKMIKLGYMEGVK